MKSSKQSPTSNELTEIEKDLLIEAATEEVEEQRTIVLDNNDVDYVKGNLRELIQNGMEALKDLAQLAKSSEHPRAYEALGGFLNVISSMNQDYIAVEEKRSKIEFQKAALGHHKEGELENGIIMTSPTALLQMMMGKKTVYQEDEKDSE